MKPDPLTAYFGRLLSSFLFSMSAELSGDGAEVVIGFIGFIGFMGCIGRIGFFIAIAGLLGFIMVGAGIGAGAVAAGIGIGAGAGFATVGGVGMTVERPEAVGSWAGGIGAAPVAIGTGVAGAEPGITVDRPLAVGDGDGAGMAGAAAEDSGVATALAAFGSIRFPAVPFIGAGDV